MTILGGPMKGMQDWMMEVQFRRFLTLPLQNLSHLTLTLLAILQPDIAVTSKIKERVYARNIPLNPSERRAIMAHTQHWLVSRGGGCDTSQPHVQIVILALSEMARS